jgi:hypothetical protein
MVEINTSGLSNQISQLTELVQGGFGKVTQDITTLTRKVEEHGRDIKELQESQRSGNRNISQKPETPETFQPRMVYQSPNTSEDMGIEKAITYFNRLLVSGLGAGMKDENEYINNKGKIYDKSLYLAYHVALKDYTDLHLVDVNKQAGSLKFELRGKDSKAEPLLSFTLRDGVPLNKTEVTVLTDKSKSKPSTIIADISAYDFYKEGIEPLITSRK